MGERVRPTRKASRGLSAVLGAAIAVVGFATLMTRLEVTREGYRVASLSAENARLVEQNRTLQLEAAQLSSHDRLRSLASRYHLVPPGPRQVVMMP